MVERDDIRQELWVAYLCADWWHESVQETAEDPTEAGEQEAYRLAVKRLRRELRNAGERMCRREKAAKLGYQTQDEAFYSHRALGQLVTAYLAHGVQDAPPRGREDSVRRPAPGAGSQGEYLVSLVDVGEALKRLKPGQIEILTYAYGPDWAHMTDDEIAGELRLQGWKDMDADRLRSRVRWAINRLQRELGGSNPWGRGQMVA
jgi:hypothetical protein